MIREDILIKNTTREQREQIVNDALGIVDGLCDGCSRESFLCMMLILMV